MQITQSHEKISVLAFVEGTMERLFVNNNFDYVHLVPVENGASWTPEKLANQIGSKFFVKNASPDLIVVWLDKEEPTRCAKTTREKILGELAKRGAALGSIHICIPDLTTENVILADEQAIREYLQLDEYSYQSEGKNGKAEIKKLFASNGKTYSETFEGTRLLKKIRLSRSAKKSPSAKDFLSAFPLDCWWIG